MTLERFGYWSDKKQWGPFGSILGILADKTFKILKQFACGMKKEPPQIYAAALRLSKKP